MRETRGMIRTVRAALLWAAVLVCAVGCGMSGGQNAPDGQKTGTEESTAASGTEAPEGKASAEDRRGDTGKEAAEGKGSEKAPEGQDGAAAMGRYVESGIPLPQEAEEADEGTTRTMALLSDGRIAYFDPDTGLLATPDEGETWTRLRDTAGLVPEDGGYVSGAAISPDGNLSLVYVEESEGGTLSSRVIIAEEGGVVEIPGGLSGEDYLKRLFFDGEGGLYGVSARGKVTRVDAENRRTEKLFTAADIPEMLAFDGKNLLALERDGVEIYDLAQNALAQPDQVLNDFCREDLRGLMGNYEDSMGAILLPEGEDHIYVASRIGLYGHVRGGNAMERLMDGDYSSMGAPTATFSALARLGSGEFLLLLNGGLLKLSYDPSLPAVPKRQLKVYSLEENDRINQAANLFRKQNPDVYVSYEYGMEEGMAVTAADAVKNLNVELMSGEGPDVILMDGMSAEVYEEKGLLRDLTPLLSSFSGEDELFVNIAAAYKKEEGTFVIPAGFKLPFLFGKKEDLSSIEDLASLADFAERAAGESDGGMMVMTDLSPGQVLRQLMNVSSYEFLDKKELNEEKLRDFFVQAKRIYEANNSAADSYYAEMWRDEDKALPIGRSAQFVSLGASRLGVGLARSVWGDIGVLDAPEAKEFSYKLWPGRSGPGFIPFHKLAVAAGTGEPELAESFVRLMLLKEVQEIDLADVFPVSKAGYDALCKVQEGVLSGGIMHNGVEKDFSINYPGPETTGKVKELMEEASCSLEGNPVVEEAVAKYGVGALTGEMSVEEAVDAVRQKVSIYLAE